MKVPEEANVAPRGVSSQHINDDDTEEQDKLAEALAVIMSSMSNLTGKGKGVKSK